MSIVEQLDSLFRESGAGLRREMDRRGPTLAKVTNVTDPEKFNRVDVYKRQGAHHARATPVGMI